MNKAYAQSTVGEIVAHRFDHSQVFYKHGIDFCCGGATPLSTACQRANVDMQQVIDELQANEQTEVSPTVDFNNWPTDLLVDYILKYHHRRIRQEGPQILELLDKVCRAHGERHPELFEVHAAFSESFEDLNSHLMKEEMVLFPYLEEMLQAQAEGRPLPGFHCGSVESPIAAMMGEHDAEGERFRHIEALTGGYTAPEDACNTYRLLYLKLKMFQEHLHHHIHLENNIAFPKAVALQYALAGR